MTRDLLDRGDLLDDDGRSRATAPTPLATVDTPSTGGGHLPLDVASYNGRRWLIGGEAKFGNGSNESGSEQRPPMVPAKLVITNGVGDRLRIGARKRE